MMKRIGLAAALVVSVATGLVPASAHEMDIQIVGAQFGYTVAELPPEFGLARYLSTPAGPVDVSTTPSADDVASITNRDPVPHTFTECAADCDTAVGVPGTLFDFEVAPGATVSSSLPPGTYTVMCRVHLWMRGEVRVSGS